jgi:hypothetical protein
MVRVAYTLFPSEERGFGHAAVEEYFMGPKFHKGPTSLRHIKCKDLGFFFFNFIKSFQIRGGALQIGIFFFGCEFLHHGNQPPPP